MKNTRRLMIQSFLVALMALSLSACLSSPKIPQVYENGLSVLQGVTDTTSTRINVVFSNKEPLSYVVTDSVGNLVNTVSAQTARRAGSDWSVLQLHIKNLKLSETYRLELISSKKVLIDARTFRTLDTSKQNLRFAVTSCSDDGWVKADQKRLWTELKAQQPDLLFLIGDNVYGDWRAGKRLGDVDGNTLWERYVEMRNTLQIYKSPELVSTIATWDDHDYGMNDGDRTNPHRADALTVFKTFFDQADASDLFQVGPGTASSLTVAGQKMILLDGRYFRTPNSPSPICKKMPDNKLCQPKRVRTPESKQNETQLGAEQVAWLKKELSAVSSTTPVWLFKGDQFWGAYHPFESYEGNHGHDFKRFLSEIRKSKRKVLFVSGDRHMSEVMKIDKAVLGYPTYEITSSAIHAIVFPPDRQVFPNKRAIEYVPSQYNYTIIEAQKNKRNMNFKIKNFSENNKLNFERDLKLAL